MKKILTVMAVSLLAVAGCSRWTEPEALEYQTRTPAEQDKSGYDAYLKRLRDWKRSNHKIVMVTMPGTTSKPVRQPQHLTAVPDYVDYICMYDAEGLHPEVAAEIAEVTKQKGTQVLCVVDYMAIENEWEDYLSELKGSGVTDLPTVDDYAVYCRRRTQAMLDCCDASGFAGIVLSYTGTTASDLKTRGQEEFMECYSAWRRSHRNRLVVLHGYIKNIKTEYRSVIEDARYIVLWSTDNTTPSQLTIYVAGQLVADVPTDRFVIETSLPTADNPTQTGVTAEVAAKWVTEEDARFTKSGLYMSTIQDDYYNAERNYTTVWQSAMTMNPDTPQF